MTSHRIRRHALLACLTLMIAAASQAELRDPTAIPRGYVGPLTPYGETPEETAAKKVMFDWVHMVMVDRKPQEAFEKYVSRDYCNHGHLSTGGQRDCANYEETLPRWIRNYSSPLKPGEKIEIPHMATVNGEMVTMYGQGVDIFGVQNGRITDHWDASPPAEITLHAHVPEFAAWVMGDRKGPMPVEPDHGPGGIVVTQQRLTAVDVGPVTPYGETPQEAANKRVVFSRLFMAYMQGKPREAIEKYYAENFCGHGHLSNGGKRLCSTRQEAIDRAPAQRAIPKVGDRIEVPFMASVNGEMVTVYGKGVDIFRVHDGKVTDHWDASPPADITVPAHDPVMVERMIRVVAGEAPAGGGPGSEGVAVTLPGDIDVAALARGNPNKRVALNYLQLVNQGQRPEAVRRFAAPTFVNHRSPMSPAAQREANAKAIAAGTQAVPPSASSGAVLKGRIGRVIAEGEYVMIHYLVTNNADIGRKLVNASGAEIGTKVGTNVVDIFRLQNGKIVEKWDAIEAIDRLELFE